MRVLAIDTALAACSAAVFDSALDETLAGETLPMTRGHAEALLHRMLYLEGSPNMARLFDLHIGQNVKQMIENALALEYKAVPRLNKAINAAVEAGDNGSRDLFESILKDEEHHIDFLEAQLHMIQEMGYENYVAQQMKEEE